MRRSNEQGQPYDDQVKRLVIELIQSRGGNISEAKRILADQCSLTICYPTLLSWAREAGIVKLNRGRPVQSRIEQPLGGRGQQHTTTRKGHDHAY